MKTKVYKFFKYLLLVILSILCHYYGLFVFSNTPLNEFIYGTICFISIVCAYMVGFEAIFNFFEKLIKKLFKKFSTSTVEENIKNN